MPFSSHVPTVVKADEASANSPSPLEQVTLILLLEVPLGMLTCEGYDLSVECSAVSEGL